MRGKQPVKLSRYYGLRIVSIICKALALIIVLAIIGGAGYMSLPVFTLPLEQGYDYQWWLRNVLILVITGGLLAFTFFVLSQIMDVQIEMNEKLRLLADHIKSSAQTEQKLLASFQQLVEAVDRQGTASTPLPSAPEQQEQRPL